MMHLLRKELSELINKQMLISLVMSFVIISMLGSLMTTVLTDEFTDYGTVRLIDQDQTEFTQQIIDRLQEDGYTVEMASDFTEGVNQKHWSEATLLPEGMTDLLLVQHEQCQVHSYTLLKTTSSVSLSMMGDSSTETVMNVINALLSEEYLQGDLAFLENPILAVPYTQANNRTVQANPSLILSSLTLFDQLMPLLLFLLVVLTAQTIITAIAAEKADKTLETLLSSPVPRTTIIGAKMLAALIVALIYAVTYGVAFLTTALSTISGQTENMNLGETFTDIVTTRHYAEELLLQIPAMGWVGVLAQLALTLGITLTASIILGALVEDAKNTQYASLPIMLCTMFPYVLSMVSDIRNMGAIKWLLYCIPFTHTFIATANFRFHDLPLFFGGLAYQTIFLVAMVVIALKLYSSDILFVHQSIFSKKNKTENAEA
ncbi:MAG: ABC transporter permease [Oscillospiraceae bacterium]